MTDTQFEILSSQIVRLEHKVDELTKRTKFGKWITREQVFELWGIDYGPSAQHKIINNLRKKGIITKCQNSRTKRYWKEEIKKVGELINEGIIEVSATKVRDNRI